MAKATLLDGKNSFSINEPDEKREKMANKIENLWKPKYNKSSLGNKKLTIKFESNGNEKRKILLKLECGNHNINSNNFGLISELLKEFFNQS
ncbi:MAG: hypothetical protein ACTSQJ_17565 [Promethearchaeota archaeon]